MYKRIVSMAPSNTEILYALGVGDKIVAVTRYCDFPAEAKKKPKIGGWLDIKDELVMGYKPDLLLTSTFVQNEITEKYKKMGMNVVSLMPTTLVGVFNSIKKIGKLVGREKEAELLARNMNKRINEIKSKVKNADFKPRLYIEEWHKPPTISGNWVPTLARFAGADYSLIRAGYHSREVFLDEIQKYNPEFIVVSICGLNDRAPKEWIIKREGWENIRAVKNNNVHVFDDSLLNRPGPRLVDGLEKLASMLHPEIFGKEEAKLH
ncbi:cobalamin-binding protein [Candidatus Woesearchaeota archaeon]|nr:cobalamin-binding protein [Candidatus Woesearchaeota archaeon]